MCENISVVGNISAVGTVRGSCSLPLEQTRNKINPIKSNLCSSQKEILMWWSESEAGVQAVETEDKLITEKCFIYIWSCVLFWDGWCHHQCPLSLALEKLWLSRRREVLPSRERPWSSRGFLVTAWEWSIFLFLWQGMSETPTNPKLLEHQIQMDDLPLD